MLKRVVKRVLLRRKGLVLDRESDINFNVELGNSFEGAKIKKSHVHLTSMRTGCSLEYVIGYGDIILGRYVSLSGPGIILHAEDGKISIGDFCSIGQNVSIQQFNHNIKRPSSCAMGLYFFDRDFREDVTSKGDIEIGEDVWIGSNATILSGVKIGRGAVIAAGAVVTRDVEPYSINGGVPSRKIKMRFSDEQISILEKSRWWTWNEDEIIRNKKFFMSEVTTNGL